MIGAGIRLPEPSLRRSYFAKLLSAGGPFERLLRELAPARWVRVRGHPDVGPMAYYNELIAHLQTLFPVAEVDFDAYAWEDVANLGEEDPDDLTEEQVSYYAHDFGIPVYLYGLDWHDLHYDGGVSPAIALTSWLFDPNESSARVPEALKKHARIVDVLSDKRPLSLTYKVKPPAGREFRDRWQALPDLVDYCRGSTGFAFLDYSRDDMDEYPWWNIDEINGLARQWASAKPIWDGIQALAKYVKAKPAERLAQLGRALTGDKTALLHITQPAPPMPEKTLADILFMTERVEA